MKHFCLPYITPTSKVMHSELLMTRTSLFNLTFTLVSRYLALKVACLQSTSLISQSTVNITVFCVSLKQSKCSSWPTENWNSRGVHDLGFVNNALIKWIILFQSFKLFMHYLDWSLRYSRASCEREKRWTKGFFFATFIEAFCMQHYILEFM